MQHKHWLYAGLIVFLLLAAVFYIVGRAGGAAKPWVWSRGDAEAAPKVAGQNIGFTAHLAFTTSVVNAGSSSFVSHRENGCLDAASVIVRPDSEHPLAVICAQKIAERLMTLPAIQRIEFIPHGPLIRKDEMLPSLFVRVDVDDLNEWMLPNRSLSGSINVAFGATTARSTTARADGGALVHFEQNASNGVRFTCTGISTQSAFYGKIADEIAKKTVDSLKQDIEKLNETNPMLPKMPVQFYPAYREASPVPPIPGFVSQTTIIDGRRFMKPHYSLVHIESNFNGTDNEFLTEIHQAMSEDGWYGHVHKSGEHTTASMEMTKGDETFYLFKEYRGGGLRLTFNLEDFENKKTLPVNGPPHVFMLERTEIMDKDSILAAIQTLLDENASASTLLMFMNRLSDKNNETVKELREQIRTRLLEWKTATPVEQFVLVRFFKEEGDKDIAKEMLFKAWRIRQLTPNPKSDNDYTKLAKELDVEEEMKAQPPLTAELCEEYGYVRITPENCPFEINVKLDDEPRFIMVIEDGQIAIMQYKFRYENGAFHQEKQHQTFGKGGNKRVGGWSSGGMDNFGFIGWGVDMGDQGSFTFRTFAESPDKPIRVKVEFERK